MGNCRAVNEFVNTILGKYFTKQHTPAQLVLALRESSKHPDVRMLFKSAGLTDVEDLDGMLYDSIMSKYIVFLKQQIIPRTKVTERMIYDRMSNHCTLQWLNHRYHPIIYERFPHLLLGQNCFPILQRQLLYVGWVEGRSIGSI